MACHHHHKALHTTGSSHTKHCHLRPPCVFRCSLSYNAPVTGLKQQRVLKTLCNASPEQGPQSGGAQPPQPPPALQQQDVTQLQPAIALDILNVSRLVGTPWYSLVCLAELVVLLGVVDAAYSGDWSRIGAISKDAELALQKLVWVISAGHLVTAGLAAKLATQRGQSWVLPAVKGFLFGALGIFEQQVLLQREQR